MEFERFLQGIAFALLMNEDFYGILLEAKIAPELWPSGPARDSAARYLEIRGRESHPAAAATLYQDALKFQEHAEVPFNAEALRVVFHRKQKAFQIDVLIERLRRAPERASDHIRAFEEGQKNGSEMIHLGSDIDRGYADLVARAETGTTMRPIDGYPMLTKLVSGFNPERFALFIAKSGFGKTTAMVNLSLAACRSMSVLYVNMEMSQQDFLERAVCAEGGIEYADFIQHPKFYSRSVEEIQQRMISKDFHFSTGRGMSLGEIKAECVMRKKRTGLDFVVIDYDQKIDLSAGEEEWRAVQNATKFFEDLAKELQCYIMLLAQEGDGGDISSSKRAKFVATTVFRFFREEDPDENGQPVYVIEAMKNRYGRSGAKIRMDYAPSRLQLREMGEMGDGFGVQNRSVQTIREKLRQQSGKTQRPHYVPGSD
jgi:KaiC/GvpD/RAD55 family RecA-like ATPase